MRAIKSKKAVATLTSFFISTQAEFHLPGDPEDGGILPHYRLVPRNGKYARAL
jgi:hypothetical protein